MFTILTVIRNRPEISAEDFRYLTAQDAAKRVKHHH
jgi:hypothetical protein